LAEQGFRLGLEYVSPRTRRADQPHPFLHSLAGLLELLDTLAASEIGVLLDSFHWYCAQESASAIRSLGDRLVAVHVNDALSGRIIDEQLATERDLPGSTGVIPLREFMEALQGAGYKGPVVAEPMNAALNRLSPDEKLRSVRRAMGNCLALASGGLRRAEYVPCAG